MTLLSVVWDVNPVLLSLGSLEIRWYGLSWAIAFGLGMWLFYTFVKREGLPEKTFDSAFWFGTLSTIIGARIGHCLFYDPGYYLSHPLEILYIWQGGLASHGAAVGLLVGLWLFSRRNKLPYFWPLDRIMTAVTIGGAAVRLGNLMNSEIYGGPTTKPWGFEFVRDPHWSMPIEAGGSGSLPCHPTQIYEALSYIVIFVILYWLYFRKDTARKYPGFMFGLGVSLLFLARFLIEFIKNPQVAFEQNMTFNMGQLLSIPFILAGIAVIVYSLNHPVKAVPSKAKAEPTYPSKKK